MEFEFVRAKPVSGEAKRRKRRQEMKSTVKWVVVIGLLAASLLLVGCGGKPDAGHVGPVGPQGNLGPQGDVGPQGSVGPQGTLGPSSDVGPSSENAIVIKDTGEPVQSEYALGGFSQVAVSDFFEAEIRQGDTYRVTVEAEVALMPYIEVFVQGKTLQIGLKPDYIYNIENASQRVEVTLPTLTQVMVGNHSELLLDRFETEDDLRLEATDFSLLQGSVKAGNLKVEVSNHSELDLTGSASQVMGEVTSFSDADLTGFKAAEVNIDTDAHSSLAQ